MNKDEEWNRFTKSGSVNDYLKYSNSYSEVDEADCDNYEDEYDENDSYSYASDCNAKYEANNYDKNTMNDSYNASSDYTCETCNDVSVSQESNSSSESFNGSGYNSGDKEDDSMGTTNSYQE